MPQHLKVMTKKPWSSFGKFGPNPNISEFLHRHPRQDGLVQKKYIACPFKFLCSTNETRQTLESSAVIIAK